MRNKLWRNFGAKLLDPYTVKVMIMSRYRYRPVTVPLPHRDRPVTVLGPTLPTVTVFGPTLPNVTQRDINVTDRYRILPLLALQALPILKGPFEQIFKVLLKKLM